jgi:hypothetical protein
MGCFQRVLTIVQNYKHNREHRVSEKAYVPSSSEGETPTLLGPLILRSCFHRLGALHKNVHVLSYFTQFQVCACLSQSIMHIFLLSPS